MTYEEFRSTEQRLLSERFREKVHDISSNGFKPAFVEDLGAYSIALRYGPRATNLVGELSTAINNIVESSVRYGVSNCHSTFGVYGTKTDGSFSPDSGILDTLSSIVDKSLPEKGEIVLYQGEWLTNENTQIAAGVSGEGYYNTALKIIENAKKEGIEVGMPWASHMSIARPQTGGNPDQARKVLEQMAITPSIGLVRPLHIDVGYVTHQGEDFQFHTNSRFDIV